MSRVRSPKAQTIIEFTFYVKIFSTIFELLLGEHVQIKLFIEIWQFDREWWKFDKNSHRISNFHFGETIL